MKKLLFIIFLSGFFFFMLPGLYAQSNQTVPNGATVKAVKLDADCNYTWINSDPSIGLAASGTGSIPSFTAINTGITPVTATITARPTANGFAYIGNANDETLSIIDASTNKFVKNITVGYGFKLVAISPDQRKVYVSTNITGSGSALVVIDVATNTIASTINFGQYCSGLIISPDGSKLYVSFQGGLYDGSVTIYNLSDLSKISSINFNAQIGYEALSPDGSRLYVINTDKNAVTVVNTITNSIIANIPIVEGGEQLAISGDGSRLYVSCVGTNIVSVINTSTNKVLTTIPIGSGTAPVGLAVSKDGSRIYVTVTNGNTIAVINGITNTLMPPITVGKNPISVCITPDGNFLYAVNESSNNVSVIDTKTNGLVATIPAGNFPNSNGNFISARIGCEGVTYTITVNPSAVISQGAVSGTINACQSSPSASPAIQQFTVSGTYLSADITATAPAGFEVSLNSTTGYGASLTLTQNNGTLNNTIVYVRSSATAPAGNISGNVILSAAGATDQRVAVSGTVNTIPTVNTLAPQTLLTGAMTAPVNISGTAVSYTWTNDTPGIGLAENGTGDIPTFTAVNNTLNSITATITIIPLNGTNCSGTAVKFTITVKPLPISLNATGTLNPLATTYGTPSAAERFTVSGTTISSGISIKPPAGFEASTDGITYNISAVISGMVNIPPTQVYIRLASAAHVGSYNGNVVISTDGIAAIDIKVPASTVTPAPLTIAADNKTKNLGAANPALTVTYTGFVNNDGPAQLTAQPQVMTSATTSSAVGSYPISVGNAVSPDYTITYIPGIMTVNPYLTFSSIPNAFTPNADGTNDTWVIPNLEYYRAATVNVFNRWGQKVFASVGYPIAWNGTYQGKALPTGTYYYIIDLKNSKPAFAGWVAIIR